MTDYGRDPALACGHANLTLSWRFALRSGAKEEVMDLIVGMHGMVFAPKTDSLVELRTTGEVIWSETASPAEIMNPDRTLEPTTRCAMLALWFATHPAT